MRILIVASGNHEKVAPFIIEQADALRKSGHEVKIQLVEGHGLCGYLRNLTSIKIAIQQFKADILHAHYGLCGLLCTFQHQIPVVVTYHGSDINDRRIRLLSRLTMQRADGNIFVSSTLHKKISKTPKRAIVQPCGIDIEKFPLIERIEARQRLGWKTDGKYVLFAGSYQNKIKNPTLARSTCKLLPEAQLIELNGYSREEVALLMNAADALLLTSKQEGSPQVTKEALACNLPIVSVNVGDVPQQLTDTQGGVITDATPRALAEALQPLLTRPQRTKAREHIEPYDNHHVVERLCQLYNTILHE